MIQKTHSEECWKWHLECAVARVEKLSAEYSELREKYHDLLYQVGKKWPGESRHDTAKRYIREADTPCAGCRGDSDTHICHEQCKSAAPSTQQKSKPTNP